MLPGYKTTCKQTSLVSVSWWQRCTNCTLTFQTDWACASSLLARFHYISYNETDFAKFAHVYDYHNVSAGFNKVNITQNARPVSRSWPVQMTAFYQSKFDHLLCDITNSRVSLALGKLNFSARISIILF